MGGLKAAGAQRMGGNMAFMTPALYIMKITSHWEKIPFVMTQLLYLKYVIYSFISLQLYLYFLFRLDKYYINHPSNKNN